MDMQRRFNNWFVTYVVMVALWLVFSKTPSPIIDVWAAFCLIFIAGIGAVILEQIGVLKNAETDNKRD